MAGSTQPARGTRDFLPDDIRRRQHVIGVIRDVYERYGFEPLETPAFENIETLLGKYGEEGNKLIFKILKRGEHEHTGEADLALRYDLTVPLARVVAQYQNELPKFFKRYQIQPVWRADRPARGRFREFYQCDIDSIGSTSPIVEAEILIAVTEILHTLGFSDFWIRLNHRQLLRALLDSFEVPPGLHDSALVAVDKFDKIGVDGVRADLIARGVPESSVSRVVEALAEPPTSPVGIEAANDAVVARTTERVKADETGTAALENLAEIRRLCEGTPAAKHILIDTNLARGLSYYTGAIMEIAVEGIGSLGGGGRYDNLVGMFLGRNVPACGFSLGVERIIVVMTERMMFPPAVVGSGVDIMVTLWNENARGDAVRLASELRGGGLRADIYPEADKLGKQFRYAGSRGVPFVAIQGDEERARGEVAIKDMRSGEQMSVPRAGVVQFVRGKATARNEAIAENTENAEP
ncbi:MAG TPA: histidine--tRNA ligase [Vicinamibacterales bacterium]|nr:histidine--tRNA ligase [Vicinamibacterales bacterium]